MIEKLFILLIFLKTRYFENFSKEKQAQLYRRQVRFLERHSDFYRGKKEIPLMNKTQLMTNFDTINTVGLHKEEALTFAIQSERTRDFSKKLKGVTIGLSSGTSGNQGLFLVSNKERAMWAGTILAKALPGGQIFGHKVAFFMRADSELYETIQSKVIDFKFYDLFTDQRENFRDLALYQPTILVAPPSMLLQIARWNQGKIRPLKVISIAEVLEQADARQIRKGLGVDLVHQIYQCTEGFLGITCQYGTLHLNETFLQIEKEEISENRFYPIVTDLRRRAQPIIRYRLNDILVEKKEICPCGQGTLALEKIEGRQDDIFIFPGVGEKKEKVTIFPDLIRRCLLFSENTGDYRVLQESEQEIILFLDQRLKREEVEKQVKQEFEKISVQYEFQLPRFIFKDYQVDPNKKLRRVESHVSYPTNKN